MGLSLLTQYGINASAAAGEEIEIGLIAEYFGTVGTIPSGWQLCDGTNGTPNLLDKIIIGAGDSYSIGDTGGVSDSVLVEHSHTGTTNSAGAHSHTFSIYTAAGSTGSGANGLIDRGTSNLATQSTSTRNDHTHSVTIDSAGVSNTNTNLPPYYGLYPVMYMGA